MIEKNNYDTIDLFKLIGSIMIFVLHGSAFVEINSRFMFLWELLTRWAVPFFFITSSFLLFQNGQNNLVATCKKYIKRILILYFVWFVINLPSIFTTYFYGRDLSSLKTYLLIIRNFILSSTFAGSWFLGSCVFSCLFIGYLCRKIPTKVILLFTSVIQLFSVFSSAWGKVPLPFLLEKFLSLFYFPLNIFCGCFYFAIGKWLAENKNAISEFGVKKSLSFFVLSGIFYIIEIFTAIKLGLFNSTDQSFFVVPFSVFAFFTAYNSNLDFHKYAKVFRKFSTVIFSAQGNFLLLQKISVRFLKSLMPDFSLLNLVSFLIVFALMIVFALCILKLQSKKFKIAYYFT